jgi:hypothetical protein
VKRVLTITARNGGTTAKVRIEVECAEEGMLLNRRQIARRVLHGIADGVMEAIADADYFEVPLSRQRVGR